MEIKVNSFEELKNEIKILNSSNFIKLEVNNNNLDFSIVIERFRCKFVGNIVMDLDGIYHIFLEDNYYKAKSQKVPEELLDYYLDLLKVVDNNYVLESVRKLMRTQLKVRDIIEFANGRKGVIINPTPNHYGQIYYRLIKKDGSEGKKELLLYTQSDNYKYRCKDREYINFNF